MDATGWSIAEIARTYWIIPAGLFALAYYGWDHFNTPDYLLDPKGHDGEPLTKEGVLLTPAPPIFTTSRIRFSRYAWRYIALLQVVFLVIVFIPSYLADIVQILTDPGHQGATTPPSSVPTESTPVHYRAIWALLFLMGLMKSLPVFKDFDAWILTKLHQAALIPDDARFLADTLVEAPFEPSPAAVAAVRAILQRRDTIRVAERKAEGTLEITLLKALWLKAQLQQVTVSGKYLRYRQKLQRDIQDVASLTSGMRADLLAYFADQEKVVPADVANIDDYVADSVHVDEVRALAERRRTLQSKCNSLLYRLCLMAAMSVYATEFSPEDVGKNIRALGFQVNVSATPTWDWDAVAKTLGGVFVVLLALNLVFLGVTWALDLDNQAILVPTRERLISLTLFGTVLYGAVLLIAIKLKRLWARADEPRPRPENLIVAAVGYVGTLAIFAAMQLAFRGYLTWGPVLFALNQGLVGYFAGLYIDQSMAGGTRSWQLPAWQAALQFVATLLAGLVSPLPPGVELTFWQMGCLAVFFACQAAAAGVVMGWLFQRLYRSIDARPDDASATTSSAKMLGDLSLQIKPLTT
jgi:hypothetical protein